MDIAVVGAGLSGLALTAQLERTGFDYSLIEARSRLGGRIKIFKDEGAAFDLGPSWFWPGQPRMADLARQLNIDSFDQYCDGELSFEDESGHVHRGMGFASMQGSLRIAGGMAALIEGIAEKVPDERIIRSRAAKTILRNKGITLSDGTVIEADRIVLALPPRVAAELMFEPELTSAQMNAMRAIPTWMGGQAKFVATYDTPFWREAGLSGDAMSRHGPLVEIHDASPPTGNTAALFGFVGVPANNRQGRQTEIKSAAIEQLVRIFGQKAGAPRQTVLQDWAFEGETAASLDHQPLSEHPQYGLPSALRGLWGGKLCFCVTETAPEFGGFLEGALAAADMTMHDLTRA